MGTSGAGSIGGMSSYSSNTPTPHKPSRPAFSPLVIVLATLLGLLLVVAGFLAGRYAYSNKAAPAPGASAPGGGQGQGQGGQSQGQQPQPGETRDTLPEPPPEVLELIRKEPKREEGDPFAQGAVDAPVVIVEYSDFSCPFCAQFATKTKPEIQKLIDDGTVRFEWRDLALFPEGKTTGAAGRAAAAQGKFWEFHDLVFADHSGQGHPSYTVDQYVEFAKQAGVADLEKFRAAIEDPALEEAVFKATDEAVMRLGLRGTPAFIINDQVVSGAQPTEYFQKVIQEQLDKINAAK